MTRGKTHNVVLPYDLCDDFNSKFLEYSAGERVEEIDAGDSFLVIRTNRGRIFVMSYNPALQTDSSSGWKVEEQLYIDDPDD